MKTYDDILSQEILLFMRQWAGQRLGPDEFEGMFSDFKNLSEEDRQMFILYQMVHKRNV